MQIVTVGKGRHTKNSPSGFIIGSSRYSNYLEDYWPRAGKGLAVNIIGANWRDSIDSGHAWWQLVVWMAVGGMYGSRRRNGEEEE